MPDIGEKADGFCLPDENGQKHCLEDFLGKWVVLYFYPKDNTSGCTREAVEFSEKIEDFKKLNCEIIGISPDTAKRHKNFREKYDLKVLLLSDTEHEILSKYDAWGKKRLYGREYFGVIRTTYLIDKDGQIAKIWKNVKVKGHVNDVYKILSDIA